MYDSFSLLKIGGDGVEKWVLMPFLNISKTKSRQTQGNVKL